MKNEATFWSDWVRPLLHQPMYHRVAWKTPADTREGLPDSWFANLAWAGWLELKYQPQWPVRPSTPIYVKVTAEQLAHLREAAITKQAAFVLLGVAEAWFLLKTRHLRPDIPLLREELVALSAAHGVRGADDHLLLKALGS